MGEPPETAYVTSGGLKLGYQVVGSGPDVVFVPGLLSQIDTLWMLPASRRFFERIASFARLILYDKRGQGVSDPIDGPLTLEQDMEDLIAILDAAGCTRAALVGYSEGGPMSALTAATYPDRVSALVLCGTFATSTGMEESLTAVEAMLENWGRGDGIHIFAPSIADEGHTARFGAFERAVGSPAMIRRRVELLREIDVSSVLDTLGVPTLVLQRSGDRAAPREKGLAMARAIPGARYLEVPGDDHIPWVGDSTAELAAIEELLTGSVGATEADRVLATVMFTDIVESTRRSAELGDRRWRALVEAHDEVVRDQLDRFRGREVKTMGDGFLAVFEGPARAIRCAQAIVEGVAPLGLQVRVGLHTGECELLGADVGGLAVNIGARVGGLAAGGEVLVSRTVRDLVVGSGIDFLERGRHALKGVPGKWELFAVSA
jgi:class 3 adenylate cyclase